MPRPRTHKSDSDRAKAHVKRMADKGVVRKTFYLTPEGAKALAEIQKTTGKGIGESINEALMVMATRS